MFKDQLFPNPRLIHDLQILKVRPVTIVGNSITEFRISKLRNYRKQWVWPSRAMMSIDRKVIGTFIEDVAEFGQNSFKFFDPDNRAWNNVTLTYQGTSNYFKLTERGTDVHPIYHLGADVVVKLGGTTVAASRVIVNGEPVLAVTGANAGSLVTITGSFYYAVRMNQSDYSYGMTALDVNNGPLADTFGDISLIEVFEY